MRGRSIYFTADEIAAMGEFFDDFDIYFSAEKHKEMYEYLLHNRMWLILRKPLKEKFIALAGSAFNKFLLCLDKYYFPLG